MKNVKINPGIHFCREYPKKLTVDYFSFYLVKINIFDTTCYDTGLLYNIIDIILYNIMDYCIIKFLGIIASSSFLDLVDLPLVYQLLLDC